MRTALGLLLVCLLGCGDRGLHAVGGEVAAAADPIHFPSTWVGFPSQRVLSLRNSSTRDRVVQLSVAAPFSCPAEQTVPGGSTLEVPLTFAPLSEGLATGRVRVTDGAQVTEVAVDGLGALPVTCVASGPCQSSRFDPLTGECVEATLADGLACVGADQCLEGGACMQGVCRGNARTCNDGDACTNDSCSSASGCVHTAVTCTVPADPCKVAQCDSKRGCVQSDAPDGTSCGAADCSWAMVCITGSCKRLPVPDGAACGDASPCQPRGICRNHGCEQQPPGELTEAWHYDFTNGSAGYHGVSDAAENLYWLECNDLACGDVSCDAVVSCEAVSYTRAGGLRFRRSLPDSYPDGTAMAHLLDGTHLLYAVGNGLGSLSTATGAVEWSVKLSDVAMGAPNSGGSARPRWMVADSAGAAWIALEWSVSVPLISAPVRTVLLKVSTAAGAVSQRILFADDLTAGVLDEHDNLYLGNTSPSGPSQVSSLTPAGVERWRVSVFGEGPVATFDGHLTLSSGEVVATSTGAAVVTSSCAGPTGNALMTAGARTLLLTPCMYCKCAAIPFVELGNFPLGSGNPRWTMTLSLLMGPGEWIRYSNLVAASQGDVLVGAGNHKASALVAYTSTGTTRFSCALPGSGAPNVETSIFGPEATLLDGRLAIVEQLDCPSCLVASTPRLRVFDLPGVTPATHGWVRAGGGPSGAARPLP